MTVITIIYKWGSVKRQIDHPVWLGNIIVIKTKIVCNIYFWISEYDIINIIMFAFIIIIKQ